MIKLVVKIFITGPPRSGKTTLIRRLLSFMNEHNISYSGFFTPEIRKNGFRAGFQLVFLPSWRTVELASIEKKPGYEMRHGKYWLNPAAGGEILSALSSAIESSSVQVIVIDEIGPMELVYHKAEEAFLEAIISDKNLLSTFHISLKFRSPRLYAEIKEKGNIINLGEMEAEKAYSVASTQLSSLGRQ